MPEEGAKGSWGWDGIDRLISVWLLVLHGPQRLYTSNLIYSQTIFTSACA